MDIYRLDYTQESLKRLINPMMSDFRKDLIELSINSMKSEYQENLEEREWEFIINVNAVYGLVDYTKNRKFFRLLKENCRRKFCSGERIKLARAHNKYGEKIPSEEKIVAVYAQDRE